MPSAHDACNSTIQKIAQVEAVLANSANATISTPRVFRTPASQRYLSLVGTIVLGLTTLIFVGFSSLILLKQLWLLGVFMLAVTVFMGALTGYVYKDLNGRWGLRVALLEEGVQLDLPTARSLIHRPKAEHLTVPYSDVEAIETRYEAFRSFGMAMVQCPYVLKRKSGDRVFLFEDRALATGLAPPMYGPIAEAIATRANAPIVPLGMVEGKGGVLAVWRTDAPDWSAPSLPAEQQWRLWRHAAATGSFAGLAVTAIFILEAVLKL